jgi:2-polyprenyl-3-methyl-5-hydroxy-6-metoxy-1,4-benzoquinol methylase
MRNYNEEFQDAEAHKYAYEFDEHLRRYMLRTFAPLWSPDASRALELGCYQGDFTRHLTTHFKSVTVIDASDKLLAVAAAKVGPSVTFIHSTFEEADIDDRFDTIFLIHTLEHLDSRVETLRQIGGWLSPGGRLFVACPNANAASRQIAVRMGLIDSADSVTPEERAHGHRVTYNIDTLTRDIEAAGLALHEQGGVFFKPLANFQFDLLLGGEAISDGYLEGCYQLGFSYPDLCASIYAVCGRPDRP